MSENVWIKSGTVRNAFAEPGITSNQSSAWRYKDSPEATFQGIVSGTGAVTATIAIEFSNDGANPLATVAGTITLSGTSPQTDGFTTTAAPWKWWRATVTNITGTGATVQVYHGV